MNTVITLTIFVFHFIVRAQRVDYFVFITLLINALLYPSRVDGIKQTCRHGYIYTCTNMNIQINKTLKQT
jgi:hypothetical protein